MNSSDEASHPEVDKEPKVRHHIGRRLLGERTFFFLLLLLLIVIVLFMIWPFLSPILLAFASTVLLKPLYTWFLQKRWVQGKPSRAVALTIVSALILVAIPTFLFLSTAFSQASAFWAGREWPVADSTVADGQSGLGALVSRWQGGRIDDISVEVVVDQIQVLMGSLARFARGAILSLVTAVPRILIETVVVLVIIMVVLPRYRNPDRDALAQIVPFPAPITRLYLDKVHMMIVAMFRGTFVIAVVQGAAMGLVYWIVGVPSVAFLAFTSMILSILPLIGVSIVAWPVAVILFLGGNVAGAIFVIAMLILVVGNVDSLMRPLLVPKGAYLNPALVVLSVFGGFQLLGIVGAIYGPVMMILLVTSVEVYTKYILRGDLAPYLDDEGTLDLERLGLLPKTDAQNPRANGVVKMVNNLVGHLLARAEPSDGVES